MLKLSVIIITFNEEKHIERCLNSVKDIADEIIVVDSFSTDNTAQILQKFGVRFYTNEFVGHIQQKNFALDLTSFPHVLSLDADEELSGVLKQNILDIKKNWNFDGYYFNRLTNFYGKWIRHGDWYPDRKLRLWDKRKGRWGGVNPHDKVIMEPGSNVCNIKGDIQHYYYTSAGEHVRQLDYFSSIVAREYFLQGRKSSVLKALFHAWWRFFRAFFIKAGILDGSIGLIIASQYSFYTFLKYIKLRQLINLNKYNQKHIK